MMSKMSAISTMRTSTRRRVARGRAGRPRRALAALAAVFLAAGCSGIKPGRTPEATFEAVKRAVLLGEYQGLWGLLSASSRDAEARRIQAQQREVSARLPNFTPADKQRFLAENGISPDEFIGMTPAEVFAMEMRRSSRVIGDLRDALEGAAVTEVRPGPEGAVLEIALGDGEATELELEFEHGVYRLSSLSDLLQSLVPAGRAHRAAKTPQATYEALKACIRDEAYEDMWDLFSDGYRQALQMSFKESKREVQGLDPDDARSFERMFGVTVEDYLKMGPREILGVNMRSQFEDQFKRGLVLSRRVRSVQTEGDRAILTLEGPGGGVQVQMVKKEDRWYLAEFK
jgi:hypothetical protein